MPEKYISVFILFLLMFFYSCRHETDLTNLKEISFSNDIQPIIAGNCTQSGCHDSQGHSEFSLVTYNDVISGGDIKAGDAHNSKLYNTITNKGWERLMPPPPLPRLSSDQIKLIYIWIEQGAKNN